MYYCCISVVKTDLQLPNLTTVIRHVLLTIHAIVNSYVRFTCENSVLQVPQPIFATILSLLPIAKQ